MMQIRNKFSKAVATITDDQWQILIRKGWARKYEILTKEVAAMPGKSGSFIPPEIKSIKDKTVQPQKIDGGLPEDLPLTKRRKV